MAGSSSATSPSDASPSSTGTGACVVYEEDVIGLPKTLSPVRVMGLRERSRAAPPAPSTRVGCFSFTGLVALVYSELAFWMGDDVSERNFFANNRPVRVLGSAALLRVASNHHTIERLELQRCPHTQ